MPGPGSDWDPFIRVPVGFEATSSDREQIVATTLPPERMGHHTPADAIRAGANASGSCFLMRVRSPCGTTRRSI